MIQIVSHLQIIVGERGCDTIAMLAWKRPTQ